MAATACEDTPPGKDGKGETGRREEGESTGEAGRGGEGESMGEAGRREEGESKGEAGRREEGRVWERTNRAGWWVRQYSLRSVMTFQHLLQWNITGHFAT